MIVGSPALYVGAEVGVLVGDVGMTDGKELGVVAVGHADGEYVGMIVGLLDGADVGTILGVV